tara:strand:+ start:90 stop:887 length:798 start_codon:yes stop_codon:yes gene_type:complete
MSKNILLTSGCSWTDEKFYSIDSSVPEDKRGGWPMWPELISSDLNLKSYNLAKSGSDNKTIFDGIIDFLYKNNNVKTVIVIWSGWDRYKTMGFLDHYPIASLMMDELDEFNVYKKLYKMDSYSDFFKSCSKNDLNVYVRDVIDSTLRYIYLLSSILEEEKINYIFFQGVTPFPINISSDIPDMVSYDNHDLLKSFSESIYHSFIKKNKSIFGYPFFNFLGGKRIQQLTGGNTNLEISELDTHPNAEGQKVITKFIMGKYNDLYSV